MVLSIAVPLNYVLKMLYNRKLLKDIDKINIDNIYKQIKKTFYYDIELSNKDIDNIDKYNILLYKL